MKRFLAIITAIYFIVLLVPVNYSKAVQTEDGNYGVHFLNTGQSDCILIKSGIGNYLIDTGAAETCTDVINYLNSQNVDIINTIIITHYHDDHYGGLEKIIENKRVQRVCLPYHENIVKGTLFSHLVNKGIAVEYLAGGWELKHGKINLKAFLPEKYDSSIENNNSTVLIGIIDDIKYAFLSDAERKEESELVKHKDFRNCHVLKVSHHGLETSSSEKVVKYINPRIAVITCNGTESPDKKVVERLEKYKASIFRTDKHGAVIIMKSKILNEGEDMEIVIITENS